MLYDYSRQLCDEDNYLLLNPAEPVTYSEETNYLKEVLNKIAYHWEIMYLLFDGEKLVGTTSIVVGGRRKMHLGTFGISLLASYRHDGVGEQVSRLMLNVAKDTLHLKLVCLEVFAENVVARHLYQKLGFVEYGVLPQGLSYKGGLQDSILMYKSL